MPVANDWEEMMLRAPLMITAMLIAITSPLLAQTKGKGIRLWNLTASTISGFEKTDWGPNQTLNDKDKEVDHDERLRITGVEPGRYDARVTYPDARRCMVRGIEIKPDAVFTVEDKDLKDCNK
jgi:hypothetical protein